VDFGRGYPRERASAIAENTSFARASFAPSPANARKVTTPASMKDVCGDRRSQDGGERGVVVVVEFQDRHRWV